MFIFLIMCINRSVDMNRVSVKIDGVDYQIAGEKNEAEIKKKMKLFFHLMN